MVGSAFYRAALSWLALAGAVALGGSAQAASVSRSFTLTAVYAQSCSITQINDIAFGTLTAGSTSSSPGNTVTYDAAGTVAVLCTNGTPFGVWIPVSANANGSQRRMFNSSANAYLNYNLYKDAGRTTLYPTARIATGYTGFGGGWISNYPLTLSIYARIPSGQALSTGHYEDTLTVTVSY